MAEMKHCAKCGFKYLWREGGACPSCEPVEKKKEAVEKPSEKEPETEKAPEKQVKPRIAKA